LAHDLSAFIRMRYQVAVPPDAWKTEAIPAHLRPRVEILGRDQKPLGASRDLNSLRGQLEQQIAKSSLQIRDDAPAWKQAAQRWERFGLTGWTLGDLPPRITISDGPGLPLYAWPGLQVEEGSVSVRLFRAEPAAREASHAGVQRLVELTLQKDLAWLEKDLRALVRLDALFAPLGTGEELRASALACLKRYVLPATPPNALTAAQFAKTLEQSRRLLPGLAQQLVERVATILQMRQEVRQRIGPVTPPSTGRPRPLTDFSQLGQKSVAPTQNPFAAELAELIPPRFLETILFERLHHLPRYLQALRLRAERAAANPPKDQERARQVAPYVTALKQFESTPRKSAEGRQAVGELRWMIEEFKVSLFAQELGTAQPVSPKRLEEQIERIRTTA
jgi:ATP-dependent helicase HrpA